MTKRRLMQYLTSRGYQLERRVEFRGYRLIFRKGNGLAGTVIFNCTEGRESFVTFSTPMGSMQGKISRFVEVSPGGELCYRVIL